MINLPHILQETELLTQQFIHAKKSLYLVGGIVRDLLLERDTTDSVDIDLTTNALPEEIKEIVAPIADNLWLSGEKFGTIGIHINERVYEITTHRAESYDSNSRKPDVVYSADISEDLSRRDFTINAMAISLPAGQLIDPFGGQKDLEQGVLRTPLTPAVSFSDDPLRMLRAARFIANYKLDPVPDLVTAISTLGSRFNIVSAERILGELDKLLQAPSPARGLQLLYDTGLLHIFLPEVSPNRFVHMEKLPVNPTLRIAALLAQTSDVEIERRLRALRYPKQRISVIQRITNGVNSILTDPSAEPDYRRWYYQIGECREESYLIAQTLGDKAVSIWQSMETTRVHLGDELDDFSLPLNGDEIMELLGIEQGQIVGEAVRYLEEHRFDNGPFSKVEAHTLLDVWWAARKT
ncbi:MAG: hypothetical protein P8J01_07555 [Acidimicrobiales bacterium]|nr:CCA tRNA nucleotidyltransferase [Acidimicrobiales bacterium]MDG1846237.1 hypothetical protein [Acidimicrobiales bacterium]